MASLTGSNASGSAGPATSAVSYRFYWSMAGTNTPSAAQNAATDGDRHQEGALPHSW